MNNSEVLRTMQNDAHEEMWESMIDWIDKMDHFQSREENINRMVRLAASRDDYAGVGWGIKVPELSDEEYKSWDFKHPYHYEFLQLIKHDVIWAIPRIVDGDLIYPMTVDGIMFTGWLVAAKSENNEQDNSGK